MHTGRYREGVDEPDWVNWKTRLRCALNKARDIVECKAESRVKAEDYDPYKVYEFRPQQPVKKKSAAAAASAVSDDVTVSTAGQGAPAKAPVPTFLNNYKLASDDQIERMPSDLNEVNKSELYQPATDVQISQMSLTDADASSLLNVLDVQPSHGQASNEMQLVLYYSNKPVWQQDVKQTNGCRIYYGNGDLISHLEYLPANLISILFGDDAADTFWLPPVDGFLSDTKMEPLVQTVLERGMERGVLLQCQDSNIVAYRLCKCSIFYASHLGTGGDPRKLPLVLREKVTETVEPTVIFDYKSCFLPALNEFALHGGALPDPRVFLLIGSEKRLSEVDHTVPVYATVACRRALDDINKISALLQSQQSYVHNAVNIDDVTTEVKQMSLDSVDMSTGITAAGNTATGNTATVAGYSFTLDTGLLAGNFIAAAGFEDLDFDESLAAGQWNAADVFLTAASDAAMWSQPEPPATIDVNEFADLMVFQ